MAGAQRLNVLVVDDDDATSEYLREFLAAEGYRPTILTDPTMAVEELKRGRYQLVLLDLRMPELDGVSLLQQFRAVDSDICVIAMTAYPSIETAVATMKLNAFDYLRKPFELEDLRRVIREAIRENGLLVDLEDRLNAEVGGRVRERRIERGLTLKQLANRTGLSVSLISQIELGKSAASMSTLHKLATALAVKMTYFFETV